MTIEQTVEIPANHRLTLDVPREIPPGKAVIAFTPVSSDFQSVDPRPAAPGTFNGDRPDDETLRRQREAVEKCWGIARHIGFSSDELLENRREDLALEEAKDRRLFPPKGKA